MSGSSIVLDFFFCCPSERKVLPRPKDTMDSYKQDIDPNDLAGAATLCSMRRDTLYNASAEHLKLGLFLMKELNDIERAKQEFRAATKTNPQNGRAHYNLGILLEREGSLSGAETAYRKAIEAAPHEYAPRNNLGHVLIAKGDVAGAEEAFRGAIAVNPSCSVSRTNLALLLHYERKDFSAAEEEYLGAIKANKNDAVPHLYLGNLLRYKKDVSGAVEAYQNALAADSKCERARRNLDTLLQSERKDVHCAEGPSDSTVSVSAATSTTAVTAHCTQSEE